jgi:hypothetical protein
MGAMLFICRMFKNFSLAWQVGWKESSMKPDEVKQNKLRHDVGTCFCCGLWAHRFNLIPTQCKQQYVCQSVRATANPTARVGQDDDIWFPSQDALAWLSVATSLLFRADRSGHRQTQGTYLSVPTWTGPKARYQCTHWKIIICWGLGVCSKLASQFDWLLWHCRDFVSRNIHCWVRFFCVTLGEGRVL